MFTYLLSAYLLVQFLDLFHHCDSKAASLLYDTTQNPPLFTPPPDIIATMCNYIYVRLPTIFSSSISSLDARMEMQDQGCDEC